MTKLLQIVQTLQAEISSEVHQEKNNKGGSDYLPAHFEAYVLKDIQTPFREPGAFDSVEKFSNYMDWYASMIYMPDSTAYAVEYSWAAKEVKKMVLARFNACVV
jgi:hypothetical protein